ncbi:hypothetical protein [Pseudomonas citronellolis]|uniref:hypothetical protein n=1 Tax=Pseudomonas citronellolis TaxID=53408 RepID=UPI003CC81D8B
MLPHGLLVELPDEHRKRRNRRRAAPVMGLRMAEPISTSSATTAALGSRRCRCFPGVDANVVMGPSPARCCS